MSTRREFLEQVAGSCLLPFGGKEKDTMQDTDQMLVNEVQRLERAVEQRKRAVDKIEADLKKGHDARIDRRPRRYSIEFDFNADIDEPALPGRFLPEARTRSFLVDGGTAFYCSQVETSLRVVGQARVFPGGPSVAGQIAQVTLPYGIAVQQEVDSYTFRQNFLDFNWRIFDTGSDREWQNVEMPSIFLLSGMLSGLVLPVRAKMVGGSEVSVEITPVNFGFDFSPNAVLTYPFWSVSNYVLHFSFEGHEVRQ